MNLPIDHNQPISLSIYAVCHDPIYSQLRIDCLRGLQVVVSLVLSQGIFSNHWEYAAIAISHGILGVWIQSRLQDVVLTYSSMTPVSLR